MLVATASASYRTYGSPAAGGAQAGNRQQLSDDEQQLVARLQARDREVRQHEQAHLAAAGGLAVSGASYSYQRGPDGKNYAIGGEVGIDVSPGSTPEETLAKAERIRAAALAPPATPPTMTIFKGSRLMIASALTGSREWARMFWKAGSRRPLRR